MKRGAAYRFAGFSLHRLRDGKWGGEAADQGAEAKRKPRRAEQTWEPRHSPTRAKRVVSPKLKLVTQIKIFYQLGEDK